MLEGVIRFEPTFTVDTGFLACEEKLKMKIRRTSQSVEIDIGTKLDMQPFLQLDVYIYTGRKTDIYSFLQ